jgi:hypothetical protein
MITFGYIPLDIRLCENLEAAMDQQTAEKNLETLFNSAWELMTQTNTIFQNNLEDENFNPYGLRISKYSNVIQAFTSIRQGNPTLQILELALRDSRILYNEVDFEFYQDWDIVGQERRIKILEEIIVPHMLFVRFLEKYKREKFG